MTELARYLATGTLGFWGSPDSVEQLRQYFQSGGWDVVSIGVQNAGFASNVEYLTIDINFLCGGSRNAVANGIASVLQAYGFSNVSVRFDRSDGACSAETHLQALGGGGTIRQPTRVNNTRRNASTSNVDQVIANNDPAMAFPAATPIDSAMLTVLAFGSVAFLLLLIRR